MRGPAARTWPWHGTRSPNDRDSNQGATIIPLARPDPGPASRMSASSPRLLDRVRAGLRARHYSKRTERAYVGWIRRFILFHGKRHPDEMGGAEVGAYLSLPMRSTHTFSTVARAGCEAPWTARPQRVAADGIGFIRRGGGFGRGKGDAKAAESPALADRGQRQHGGTSAGIRLSLAG
jgi:hypothetical protein